LVGIEAAPPALALVSVNLSAHKTGKTTSTGNPYLRKTIARHKLAPGVSAAFAGKLDYRRYSWRDRQIIRFIMLLTGGPTDLATCIEYTSWEAVDAFTEQIRTLRWHNMKRALSARADGSNFAPTF
jgi:menaquinone-dependent protoporphyrinogen oxidase